MLLRSLLILLACLSLAFTATPAQAAQVQLAWDAPLQADGTPVANLAGYKLYSGSQSGQYQTALPVGMATTYTVTNVSAGQTYYFAATAYDSAGVESAFSKEVSMTPLTNTLGASFSNSRCESCSWIRRMWSVAIIRRQMPWTAALHGEVRDTPYCDYAA